MRKIDNKSKQKNPMNIVDSFYENEFRRVTSHRRRSLNAGIVDHHCLNLFSNSNRLIIFYTCSTCTFYISRLTNKSKQKTPMNIVDSFYENEFRRVTSHRRRSLVMCDAVRSPYSAKHINNSHLSMIW
jgi:hypothetical protein